MSEQPILLQIPEALYERVRQIAAETNRSIESVVLDGLFLLLDELPPADDLTPQQLETFSDAQLWALVDRPFALPHDVRLRELTALSKSGGLSKEQQAEMEQLIDANEHYVLLRSKALLLLKQRGHDVERRLMLGA